MTEIAKSIEERTLALQEIQSLYRLVKEQYGDNPPLHVIKTLAELSRDIRAQYSQRAPGPASDEAKAFLVKNGLSAD